MSRRYQLSTLAILCLVALRLGIGWHFFKEGAKKIQDPNFTSKYFLQAAKGPLADVFHGMIPDQFGTDRLDMDATLRDWKRYKKLVETRLKLNDQKKKQADKIFEQRSRQLRGYYSDYGPDIEKHSLEVQRLTRAKKQPISEIAFQRDWIYGRQAELWNAPNRWISDTQSISAAFQADLLSLAGKDRDNAMVRPLVAVNSKTFVDHMVTGVTFGVGCLLLLGLFTRLASLMGAGFLGTVMLSQPFWVAGTEPTYYQFVEILALLLLAATAAGQFWGLDFFTHALWRKSFPQRSRDDNDELDS